MKPDTWMPVYVGDYLKDTMHLSTLEHGAYTLLLYHGWQNGGRLPWEGPKLARIAGMTMQEWEDHRAVLMAFFTRRGKYIVQKRQLAELARAEEQQAAAHARGLAGGKATREAWSRLKAGLTPAPSPSPTSNNKKQDVAAAAAEFAALWGAYPRKAGKAKAAILCARLVKSGAATWDGLRQAAERYARDCRAQGTEEQFIKHGPTFFGPGQAWRDYLHPDPKPQTPLPQGFTAPNVSHYPDGTPVTAWFGNGEPHPQPPKTAGKEV